MGGAFLIFLHFHFMTDRVTTRYDTAVRTSESEHDMHTPPELNWHVEVRLLQPGGAAKQQPSPDEHLCHHSCNSLFVCCVGISTLV